jgi:hypothetical protein
MMQKYLIGTELSLGQCKGFWREEEREIPQLGGFCRTYGENKTLIVICIPTTKTKALRKQG